MYVSICRLNSWAPKPIARHHPDLKSPTVRTKRVREARDEAKNEIDAYRKSKEEEFKKFESEVR